MKRQPMPPRKVALAAGPVRLRRSPLSRSSSPSPARQAAPEATKAGGWSEDTRETVAARSRGRCEVGIPGVCTGEATDLHHRQARRSRRHDPANALHCCRQCHSRGAHGQPALAMHMGWIVSQYAKPETTPVNVHGRWCLFLENGGTESAESPL